MVARHRPRDRRPPRHHGAPAPAAGAVEGLGEGRNGVSANQIIMLLLLLLLLIIIILIIVVLLSNIQTKRDKWGQHKWGRCIFLCFLTGTFWGTPINLFLSSQKCQGVPFPQSVKIPYFCSGPISVDPICPQPKGRHPGVPAARRGAARCAPRPRLPPGLRGYLARGMKIHGACLNSMLFSNSMFLNV